MNIRLGGIAVCGGLIGLLIGVPVVAQQRYESDNYTIDASVGNTFGGTSGSTNYDLVSSGGETVIGNGEGGSYKLGQGYVAELEQALQLNVQPAGLAAYYPLDENTGTRAWDASASDNTGTLTNGPTWATGKVGPALQFDGVGDYVQIPDSTSLAQRFDMTFEAWVKLVDDDDYQPIISKGSDAEYEIAADWRGTDTHLSWRSTASGSTTNFPNFFAGRSDVWTHVAVTASATGTDKITAYRDGEYFGELTVSDRVLRAESVNIGKRTGANFWANGLIDHVKLFSRALTPAEIKAEYDAQNAGHASGLSLNTVTPGVSNSAYYDAIVATDAPGYSLSVSQDQNLTSGGNTIPAAPGTIATPALWEEGTTTGLGFSLTAFNTLSIPGKWGIGYAYAALPDTATSFYTRTGYTAGTKDVLNVELRLDVPTTQAAGDYQSTMVTTGTVTP